MFTRGAASRGVHAPPDPHDAPERQVLALGAEVIPPLVAPAVNGMPTIDYASRASTIEVGAKDVVCQWSRAHGNNRRADAIEHVR